MTAVWAEALPRPPSSSSTTRATPRSTCRRQAGGDSWSTNPQRARSTSSHSSTTTCFPPSSAPGWLPTRPTRTGWCATHGTVGELDFDEDAALSELERHPSALLDEVNRWLDRLAEIVRPPLPGPNQGHGIDLGL